MVSYGGLWYEYAYTGDYTDQDDRECSTWNLLAHMTNDTQAAQVFDVLHHQANKTANTTAFGRHALICGANRTETAQQCHYYTKVGSGKIAEMTTDKPREFQIIQSDLFTHMVASVCKSWGAFHYIDYLVMTREKTPGLFVRQ